MKEREEHLRVVDLIEAKGDDRAGVNVLLGEQGSNSVYYSGDWDGDATPLAIATAIQAYAVRDGYEVKQVVRDVIYYLNEIPADPKDRKPVDEVLKDE